MSLTATDYKEAITVQDACNISGVIFAWARRMEKINETMRENGEGGDWRNAHAINVMFASKVASLTRCEDSLTFSHAYDECSEKGEGA